MSENTHRMLGTATFGCIECASVRIPGWFRRFCGSCVEADELRERSCQRAVCEERPLKAHGDWTPGSYRGCALRAMMLWSMWLLGSYVRCSS